MNTLNTNNIQNCDTDDYYCDDYDDEYDDEYNIENYNLLIKKNDELQNEIYKLKEEMTEKDKIIKKPLIKVAFLFLLILLLTDLLKEVI